MNNEDMIEKIDLLGLAVIILSGRLLQLEKSEKFRELLKQIALRIDKDVISKESHIAAEEKINENSRTNF